MRTMRAPYTAVFKTFAGSKSAGMKTHASNPCCVAWAATAWARFPVEEQPTVSNPNRRAAASAVATTRSLNDKEGKQTASFFTKTSRTPSRFANLRAATSGVPPTAFGGVKPSASGRNSEYRHLLKARRETPSRRTFFLIAVSSNETSSGENHSSQNDLGTFPQ